MQTNFAVFWDFENIHAGAMDQCYGENWYREFNYRSQPSVLQIDAIMNRLNTLGNVVLNRAYANWQWLHKYQEKLNHNGFDLVQIYPRGYGQKNGADIRMAIDVAETLRLHPHIGTVVLLSGDTDFVPVAQLVRRSGKRVIGIGTRKTSSKILMRNCNEFLLYGNLVGLDSSPSVPVALPAGDTTAVEALVVRAMQALTAGQDSDWVQRVKIKPVLLKLDPNFSEVPFGYDRFSRFIAAFPQLLETRHREGMHEPEYRLLKAERTEVVADVVAQAEEKSGVQVLYEQRLKKHQMWRVGIEALFSVLHVYGSMAKLGETFLDYSSLDELVHGVLSENSAPGPTLQTVSQVRHIMYQSNVFQRRADGKLMFQEEITDSDGLLRRYYQHCIRLVCKYEEEVFDAAALSNALHGDGQATEELIRLHEAYLRGNAIVDKGYEAVAE